MTEQKNLGKGGLLFMITLISIQFAVGQEMSFEAYNPKSTLMVPGKEIKQSKFPFIDVHSHQRDMSVEKLTSLLKDMESLNKENSEIAEKLNAGITETEEIKKLSLRMSEIANSLATKEDRWLELSEFI